VAHLKEVVGEAMFYPTADAPIQTNHYPTRTALNKLTGDVKKQVAKRDQYHRRRTFDPEAPVDYINDRNRHFNDKLDRFYGEYTSGIKEDLERGTGL